MRTGARIRSHRRHSRLHQGYEKKLYVEAHVYAAGHEAVCVIEDAHTNITRVQLGTVLEKLGCTEELNLSALPHQDFRNIERLFGAFIEKKPVHRLNDCLPLFATINICSE